MDSRNCFLRNILAAVATVFPTVTAEASALVVYTSGDAPAAKELFARLPLTAEEAKTGPRAMATVLSFPGEKGVAITGAAAVRWCKDSGQSSAELDAQLTAAYILIDEDMAYADAAQEFERIWARSVCATELLPREWFQRLWMGWGIATALKAEANLSELDIIRAHALDLFQDAIALGATQWPEVYAPIGVGYTTFLEAKIGMASTLPSPVQVYNLAGLEELLINGSTNEPIVGVPVLLQWKDGDGAMRGLQAESLGGQPTIWSDAQWRELLRVGPITEAEHALVRATLDGFAVDTVVLVDAEKQTAWRWHTRATAMVVETLTPNPRPPVEQAKPASTKTAGAHIATTTPVHPQALIGLGGQFSWLAGHAYGGPVVSFGGRPHPRVEIAGFGQASFTRWDGYTFALPGGGVEAAGVLVAGGRAQLLLGGGVLLEVAQTSPSKYTALLEGHGLASLQLRPPASPAALRASVLVGGGNAGFRVGFRLTLMLLPP